MKDIDDSNEWLMGRMDGHQMRKKTLCLRMILLHGVLLLELLELRRVSITLDQPKEQLLRQREREWEWQKYLLLNQRLVLLTLRDEEEDIDFEEEFEEEEDFGSD